MLSRPPDQPFPDEAVRDLLGILRALYRARRAAGAGALELRKIHQVGHSLTIALDLARDCQPYTIGRSAAWKRAEQATRDAADLIKATDGAEPIVLAAVAAMRRSD